MSQKNNEKSNLIIAIALSIAILLGWQYFFPSPEKAPQTQEDIAGDAQGISAPEGTEQIVAPGLTGSAAPAIGAGAAQLSRDDILDKGGRILIETPSLSGSIPLQGARLDDLLLLNYDETVKPDSPKVTLLSPVSGLGAYFASFGWVSADPSILLPKDDTLWTASSAKLTPENPVTLRWNNGQGLTFIREISVDRDYMFTITQKVENQSDRAVTLYPFSLVARGGTPRIDDFYIQHEGPLGVVNGTLEEHKYKALREDGAFKADSTGGWVGFGDKYWLTALIPNQGQVGAYTMRHSNVTGLLDRYQTDWRGPALTAQPGGTVSETTQFFAGAKVLALLDKYAEMYKIPLFDRSIDFGWLAFLTIPFFYFLRFIYEHIGNFGIALMLFTVVIKAALFPIANRSYRSMSRMKKLQPAVKEIQERFADDKQLMNREVMELYKREKVNPVSGCLPILIQIPVFFALYKVLYVAIEMRHAPFFGWIQDLSAPDPTSLFNLFGLIPWAPPELLMVGAWPVIMGVTMFLQQKLNPPPADPTQAKIFMILPFVFTFMLARFPAGLVIYWAWSNILSIIQQWLIQRSVAKE